MSDGAKLATLTRSWCGRKNKCRRNRRRLRWTSFDRPGLFRLSAQNLRRLEKPRTRKRKVEKKQLPSFAIMRVGPDDFAEGRIASRGAITVFARLDSWRGRDVGVYEMRRRLHPRRDKYLDGIDKVTAAAVQARRENLTKTYLVAPNMTEAC